MSDRKKVWNEAPTRVPKMLVKAARAEYPGGKAPRPQMHAAANRPPTSLAVLSCERQHNHSAECFQVWESKGAYRKGLSGVAPDGDGVDGTDEKRCRDWASEDVRWVEDGEDGNGCNCKDVLVSLERLPRITLRKSHTDEHGRNKLVHEDQADVLSGALEERDGESRLENEGIAQPRSSP